jgi:nicotinate-nucleotide adenylyltransferase
MNQQPRLGILGGTFDPIHLGHVSAAEAAGSALALDEILVVASHDPPHRRPGPRVSSYHRFAMVALAIARSERLIASDLELVADGPSYTSTTLRRLLAHGFAPTQLFFITGGDAFAEIAAWNDYPAILDLGHFVVISRPGFPSASMPARLPELAGHMQTVSTGMAERRQPATTWRARDTRVFLVDAETPDVSSTEIRRQAGERHRLTGLVAPSVEQYIRRHRLYASETTPRGLW